MWTHFWDMHSGGGTKEKDYGHIFIEAPREEAVKIFYSRLKHNPERVSCTCCGKDYAISEGESLEQITAYHRGCDHAYTRPDGTECPQEEGWVPGKGLVKGYKSGYVERRRKESYAPPYVSLQQALKSGTFGGRDKFLVIRATEIKLKERKHKVPTQGFVWQE